MKWDEDNQYQGEWRDSCLHGFGVFHQKDKIYKGNFENDNRNGMGMLIYPNRNYIAGIFHDNLIEGLTIKYTGFLQVGYTEKKKFTVCNSNLRQIESSEEFLEIKKFAETQIKDTDNEVKI